MRAERGNVTTSASNIVSESCQSGFLTAVRKARVASNAIAAKLSKRADECSGRPGAAYFVMSAFHPTASKMQTGTEGQYMSRSATETPMMSTEFEISA